MEVSPECNSSFPHPTPCTCFSSRFQWTQHSAPTADTRHPGILSLSSFPVPWQSLNLLMLEIPPPKSFSHQPLFSILPPPLSRLPLCLAWMPIAISYCSARFQPFPRPILFFIGQPETSFQTTDLTPASFLLQTLPRLSLPVAVVSGVGHLQTGGNAGGSSQVWEKGIRTSVSVYFLLYLFWKLYFWACFIMYCLSSVYNVLS